MHLLRRRWFALLVAGEAVNSIGSWTSLIALWGYAAYRFHASAGDIALLGLAWALPAALFGPLMGLPIDRFGPRRVLIVGDIAGAAVALAFLTAHSWERLVLLGVLSGIIKAITLPAADALPPRLVDDEDLLAANAVLGAASDAAIVFGPLMAAVAIATAGFSAAFVVDAATFLVGAAVVFSLHERRIPAPADDGATAWGNLRAGFRLAAHTPVIRWTLVLSMAVYLTWGTFAVVEPIYVRDVLHASPTVFALLQVAFGVGLVSAGLALARIGDRAGSTGALATSVILSGLTAGLYIGTRIQAVAFVGVFLWGVDVAFFAAPSRTLLQRHSPTSAHGRVLSLNRTLHSVGDLVALPLAGLLAAPLGVQGVAFCVAGIALVGGIVGFVVRPEATPVVSLPSDPTRVPSAA